MPVLPRLNNYDDIYRQFRWQVPARYNIGVDVCDRWAAQEPDRLAILHVHPDGREDAISFGVLRETSNRLANVLRAHGVARGDRVARQQCVRRLVASAKAHDAGASQLAALAPRQRDAEQ